MSDWTPDRHSAAKRACEQATGGEWIAVSLGTEKGRAAAKGRSSICSVLRQEGVVTTAEGGQFPSSDMRFIALARTDLPAALAEIERLTARLDEEEDAHVQSLKERDAFEERIDEIADALGDETEWSSDNDRSQNAVELAEEVLADNARLRSMLNSIVASTTDPAIKAMALRALEGKER